MNRRHQSCNKEKLSLKLQIFDSVAQEAPPQTIQSTLLSCARPKGKITSCDPRITDLENDLKQSREKVIRLMQEKSAVENELILAAQAAKELEIKNRNLMSYEEQVKELQEENKNLKIEVVSLKDINLRQENDLIFIRKALKEATSSLNSAVNEKLNYEQDLANLKEEVHRLKNIQPKDESSKTIHRLSSIILSKDNIPSSNSNNQITQLLRSLIAEDQRMIDTHMLIEERSLKERVKLCSEVLKEWDSCGRNSASSNAITSIKQSDFICFLQTQACLIEDIIVQENSVITDNYYL